MAGWLPFGGQGLVMNCECGIIKEEEEEEEEEKKKKPSKQV